jgi:hypothetical protein
MTRRSILRSTAHSNASAREMLAMLFAAELLEPAPEFWVAMGWVTDVDLFRSSHSEFDAVVARGSVGRVFLSDVLVELARRGSTVCVVTRPDDSNEAFLDALRRKTVAARLQHRVRLARSEDIHQKNLVGSDWYTDGSMNLTVNGLDHLVESLSVNLDGRQAAEMRTNIRETWLSRLGAIDDRA